MTTAQLTAAALLAALAATPALADDIYRCQNGTTVTYVEATREMQIHGLVEGFVVALPFATTAGRYATWSTKPPEDVDECDDTSAPCAYYWQPASGPVVIYYQLEAGKPAVNCAPE